MGLKTETKMQVSNLLRITVSAVTTMMLKGTVFDVFDINSWLPVPAFDVYETSNITHCFSSSPHSSLLDEIESVGTVQMGCSMN